MMVVRTGSRGADRLIDASQNGAAIRRARTQSGEVLMAEEKVACGDVTPTISRTKEQTTVFLIRLFAQV